MCSLSKRANNYVVRLLTSSKEIGLRRLRSYTAALGSGAQIFHSYQDLLLAIELSRSQRVRNIILHDSSVYLTSQEMNTLSKLARIFVIDQPRANEPSDLPVEASVIWKQEAYFRCSINTFLDSPVIRMAMAQLCQPKTAFSIGNLLRWGATEHYWSTTSEESLSDTGLNFVRKLNLAGECRRITEMFTHFTYINLQSLGMDVESVRFSSDGILTALIARCKLKDSVAITYLASELRIHDFYAGLVNKISDKEIEIGALFHQNPLQEEGQEKIVVTLDKDQSALDVNKVIDFDKAG